MGRERNTGGRALTRRIGAVVAALAVTTSWAATSAGPAGAATKPATATKPTTTKNAKAAALPTRASGLPWSSGAYTQLSADTAKNFAAWRGRPLDNVSLFTQRDSWATQNNAWYLADWVIPAGWRGDVVIGVPLWPQNSNVSANADAQWRTFAQQLAARDPDAYVRLGWEMNLPGSYWAVTAENKAEWTAAFKRAVVAMHSVAPKLRIVWNPNWGRDQTNTDSRAVFQAVKDYTDVYGVDYYDAWPATTSSSSAARLSADRGLKESVTYAKNNGKKFALPEWGLGCTTDGCAWQGNAGGDNPRFVEDTLRFLGTYARYVAFESYFNEPQSYIRSELWPTKTNPEAGKRYQAGLATVAAAYRR